MPESAPAPAPEITLRRVILWCLPALLVAVWLRGALMWSQPEAAYGSDSNSYFDSTVVLWHNHTVSIGDKRRWIYPIALWITPAVPLLSPAQTTALAQHLTALPALVALGWIAAHLTRFRRLAVPAVTVLAAAFPRTLWYEHEMIADSVMMHAWIITAALAFPLSALRGRRLLWFLAGCAVIVALKPHGRPLWLGLMIAAVAATGNPLRWGRAALVWVAVALVAILTSGSSRQSKWLLMSSVFPLVKTTGEPWADYRALLAPAIEKEKADWTTYPSRQGPYKKALGVKNASDERALFGPEWSKLVRQREQYNRVLKDLTREVLLSQPHRVAYLTAKKFAIALTRPGNKEGLSPAITWESQAEVNVERWTDTPYEMELLYRVTQAEWPAFVEERRQRPNRLPLDWLTRADQVKLVGFQTKPDEPELEAATPMRLTVFGWCALAAVVSLLTPRTWRAGLFLLLPVAIYSVLVFGIGDIIPRYLVAVDWVLLLLVGVGADAVARAALWVIGRFRRPAQA